MPILMEDVLLNVLLVFTSKMENAFLLNAPSAKPTTRILESVNMSALMENTMMLTLKNAGLHVDKINNILDNTADAPLDFISSMEFAQNVALDLPMTS